MKTTTCILSALFLFPQFIIGSPTGKYSRIDPDQRVSISISDDYSVQMVGGYRWDFVIKTNKSKVLIADIGIGEDDWPGVGPFRHFYPNEFSTAETDILTVCFIPGYSDLFHSDKACFKIIFALNGKPVGGPTYTVNSVTSKKYQRTSFFQPKEKGKLPVDKNGNIRLLSAWETGNTDASPNMNLLLGLFECDKEK
jgi:hypothetical protein